MMLRMMMASSGSAPVGYPVWLSSSVTADSINDTTQSADAPSVVNSGDLLIWQLCGSSSGSSTLINAPSGWSTIYLTTGTVSRKIGLFYRIADGTEGGSVFSTSSSAAMRTSSIVNRIQAGTYGTSFQFAESTGSVTGGVLPCPTLTLSGGAINALALCGFNQSGASTLDLVSSFPFITGQTQRAPDSGGAAFSFVASCAGETSSSTISPSGFSTSNTNQYRAFTLAIPSA